NQMGNVVLSACRKEFIDVEPILAEALGVRWYLQKAIEANMKDIVIASDAATA
ncbi:isoflavone-7-O-methyltransferase, partial [Trifolium medium]|nr:isoflavone-7-O-methyltransferase [Trifolium medium]